MVKFLFAYRNENFTTANFAIPPLGQGYFHNLSMTMFASIPVGSRAFMNFGHFSQIREVGTIMEDTPYYREVSNGVFWKVPLDIPLGDNAFDTPGRYSVLHAHRSQPLYTMHGRDVMVTIDASTTGLKLYFIIIQAEWVPYKNTWMKYNIQKLMTDFTG